MSRPIHVHVEEPSMEAFLQELLPRHLPPAMPWKIINHRSKTQLMAEVPNRLRGYRRFTDPAYRPKALVLVDRDDDDCLALKAQLEAACAAADLTSPSTAMTGGMIDVVNRIVVDELEAWYFGDVLAMRQVWPNLSANLGRQARYRDPDAVPGGAHEAVLRVVQAAGYLKGERRLPKIDAARMMGGWIDPVRNISPSFGTFLTGLDALVSSA